MKGRLYVKMNETEVNGFNPRPREGATIQGGIQKVYRFVSIHAPVKGRLLQPQGRFRSTGFNPRPREGATTLGM